MILTFGRKSFAWGHSQNLPRRTHPYPLSRGEFILHTVWFHSPYFEYIYIAQKMGIFSRFLQKFPYKEGLKIIYAKQFEAE